MNKLIYNPRIINFIDQGVSSAANFLLILIIAKNYSPNVLASFIIIYGFQLLATKIHASLVTLPLIMEMSIHPKDNDKLLASSVFFKRNEKVIFINIVISLTLITIVGFFLDLSSKEIIISSFSVSASNIYEFIRRLYINTYLVKYHLCLAITYYVSLLAGVYISFYYINTPSLTTIFIGFLTPILISFIAYLISKNYICKDNNPNDCSIWEIIKIEVGTLSTNINQWLIAQVSYYVAFLFIGSHGVSTLGVIRSLFGPLNIFLLSLEGFLPKYFAVEINNIGKFKKKIQKEILWLLILFSHILLAMLFFGESLVKRLYGDFYAETFNINIIIATMCLIYLFATVSKISIIALRVIRESTYLKNVSLVALIASTITIIPASIYFNLYGLLAVSAAMELAVALLFSLKVFKLLEAKGRNS